MPQLVRTDLRPGRRFGLFAVILGLGGLLVTGPARPASGTDPYVAGGDLTRVSPLAGSGATAAIDRAVGHERALGLDVAARRTVERVTDRREARTYDEVTDLDAKGRPQAVLRYDLGGRLVSAVRLGWLGGRGRALATDPEAAETGRRLAIAAGLAPAGTAQATHRGSGGWTVTWARIVDDVPVPGDGLRVQLWEDGSFHALAATERPLGPRPTVVRSRTEAEAVVGRLLDRWIPAASRGDAAIADASLAWVAPNDTFDGARPDAPGDVLRLAWVVRVHTSGALAESLRGLEVAVDAGDGSLLGGDVLR